MAGELAKRHEKKKTLQKEEEELELEDSMEYAGNQDESLFKKVAHFSFVLGYGFIMVLQQKKRRP